MAIERPSKRTSEHPDEHEVDKLNTRGHGPVIAEADAARLSGRVKYVWLPGTLCSQMGRGNIS